MKGENYFVGWGLNKDGRHEDLPPMDYRLSKQVGYEAMCTPDTVCWWCGRGAMERMVGDHICPILEDMPIVAACQSCNKKRVQRLPHAEAMQRLLFGGNIVRDRSAAETKLSIEDAALRLFGSLFWTGLVVALSRRKGPVYRASKDNRVKNDGGVLAENENRKLQEVGLL